MYDAPEVMDRNGGLESLPKPKFKHRLHADGEVSSKVDNYVLYYPAEINGRLGDLAFIENRKTGLTDFVHFSDADGRPYGHPACDNNKVATRLMRMREEFEKHLDTLRAMNDAYRRN